MNRLPESETTPSRTPPRSTTHEPCPGWLRKKLAGRRIRSSWSRYAYTSRWRYAWLPSVITSIPAAKMSLATADVIPAPPAAFSPLAIAKSGEYRARSDGSGANMARLPTPPTMSPMNRMVMGLDTPSRCSYFQLHAVRRFQAFPAPSVAGGTRPRPDAPAVAAGSGLRAGGPGADPRRPGGGAALGAAGAAPARAAWPLGARPRGRAGS